MMFLLLLIGCFDVSENKAELVFLRHAVIAPQGEALGQGISKEQEIVSYDWTFGEQVSINGASGIAPLRAECRSLYSRGLGDVSTMIAMQSGIPNTHMAWSPDEKMLAVGSHLGEILILDGWTGKEVFQQVLAESMVKFVAWSPDGKTLYAVEQSPDAFVYAFNAETWSERWKLPLSDIVERSTPPSKEDVYGVYTLPGAFGLDVLSNGNLIIPAVHAWRKDGVRHNKSQLLRVSPAGQIIDKWPDQPTSITLKHPKLDEQSDVMLISVERTAEGEAPEGFPIGGIQILRLSDFTPQESIQVEPLRPWFQHTMLWEGLGLSKNTIFLGFSDGRVILSDLQGNHLRTENTGAPILAGDVPIHAIVGWAVLTEKDIVYNTSSTYIPYGAASAELRPPSLHPNENGVFVLDLDGEEKWKWQGEHYIQGLSIGENGNSLLVGAGDRQSDHRQDLYGALIFNLRADDTSGKERLEAICMTPAPVFFRHAMTSDGRLALAEHPFVDEKGVVQGQYRINIMR